MTKDTQKNNNYKNIEYQKHILTKPNILKKNLGLLIKEKKVQPVTQARYLYPRRDYIGQTLLKILRQQHTDLQADHVVVTPISKNRDIIDITFTI